MDHIWIGLTVMAALLQAVRTAAQRDLNRRMSTLATTYVRSLFGLPLLAAYMAVILAITREGMPPITRAWLGYTFAGAMAQVIATMLLIMMFRLKSFGVGTMLTKTDVVITALMGAALFSERLTFLGVVALIVVLAGVAMMSMQRASLAASGKGAITSLLSEKATLVALGCAVAFSISYLTLREATLVIGPGTFLWRGGWTVLVAIAMQTVLVGVWLAWAEPHAVRQIAANLRPCTFIGITSAIGSIGWFTAFALQNASYVRAVGQVEVVFTLMISALYFGERISGREYVGIALTVLGVLLFRLAA